MSRWKWALLIFELALFAIILIAPQVDLPDFTFHRGTAPVVAKANLSITLDRALSGISFAVVAPTGNFVGRVETSAVASVQTLDSRLSLLCTLIC